MGRGNRVLGTSKNWRRSSRRPVTRLRLLKPAPESRIQHGREGAVYCTYGHN